ncbi:hypothetical protein FACS1894192_01530 [Bacilli bacterium]|nr:hypothetical protein FACS1894192_01530 [Bacilli bacterium]
MVIKDTDKQNKLTAGLDWVQFQIDMKIENIITDVLGLEPELFIEKSGNLRYYDYEKYWVYGEIKLYFSETSDTPCMLQFSGSGWAFYKDNYLDLWEVTEFSYIKFLDSSFGQHIDPKRLDIRLDDFNDKPYYTPKSLLNYCQKRRILYGRSTIYKPFGDDYTGRTLYLGADDSTKKTRIYDKLVEQAKKFGIRPKDLAEDMAVKSWIRTETEFRQDDVKGVWLEIIKTEQNELDFYKGYLKGKIKFLDKQGKFYSPEFWRHFMSKTKAWSYKISKKQTPILDKINWFIEKGALPILKMYQFLYDNEISTEPFEQYPMDWLIEESRYSKSLATEIIKYLAELNDLSEDKKMDLIKQVQHQTKDTNSLFD